MQIEERWTDLRKLQIKRWTGQMDGEVKFEIHYGGPNGNLEQDLRLIEDDKDVVSMCKLNEGGPRDTIILYVESGHAPLAVEVPNGVGGGAGVGVWATTRGAGVGARTGVRGGARATTESNASVGVDEKFDWLNEGLEGEEFVDDIFGDSSPPHTIPSEPNTILTADTPQPNTNIPQPNTDTPAPSNVYRSRKAARSLITGNEEAQYDLLRDYAEMDYLKASPSTSWTNRLSAPDSVKFRDGSAVRIILTSGSSSLVFACGFWVNFRRRAETH
ncbi:hypothetical protein CFP56_041843 [Quercus suber]|uniref:Uncharacterized protein n=1 Tax=Quercus suber TaxID=58331 RepID=A0AAW0IU07_QUESU